MCTAKLFSRPRRQFGTLARVMEPGGIAVSHAAQSIGA